MRRRSESTSATHFHLLSLCCVCAFVELPVRARFWGARGSVGYSIRRVAWDKTIKRPLLMIVPIISGRQDVVRLSAGFVFAVVVVVVAV